MNLNVENVIAFDDARASRVDPTDVNTRGENASSADVIVQDADYSSYCGFTWHVTGAPIDPLVGVVGLARCNSIWAGPFTNFCNQHGIYIDTSFTTPASVAWRRDLASHEIGHTLGAFHEENSVMRQGYPKPTANYGTHVIGEINAVY